MYLHAYFHLMPRCMAVFCVSLFVTAFVVLWLVPIPLGIRCAIRKHYSPYWMWFGLHPLGGWIAFVVLASLPGRVECGHCGGYVEGHFRICPYCHASLAPPVTPASPSDPPRGDSAGERRTAERRRN